MVLLKRGFSNTSYRIVVSVPHRPVRKLATKDGLVPVEKHPVPENKCVCVWTNMMDPGSGRPATRMLPVHSWENNISCRTQDTDSIDEARMVSDRQALQIPTYRLNHD